MGGDDVGLCAGVGAQPVGDELVIAAVQGGEDPLGQQPQVGFILGGVHVVLAIAAVQLNGHGAPQLVLVTVGQGGGGAKCVISVMMLSQ